MSFKNSPQIKHKGGSPYLSRQSSNNSSYWDKPQKNLDPPSPLPVGCCRGFGNTKTTGSSASTSQQHPYKRMEGKVSFMHCVSRTECTFMHVLKHFKMKLKFCSKLIYQCFFMNHEVNLKNKLDEYARGLDLRAFYNVVRKLNAYWQEI